MLVMRLLFVILATWYLTQAVTLTKGPFNIFKWAREKLPHGGLLECHICFGLWAGLFFSWLSMLGAPANEIILQGVAAAGIFVILWDGTVFLKTVIEAWLYALQMAAQQPTEDIAELRAQVGQLSTQIAHQNSQFASQITALQADVENFKNAQQDIAPFIAILRENGCGPVESRPDQPKQQQSN